MPPSTMEQPHSGRRARWAGALIALWLAGSALGFWWFTMKDLRSFAPQAQLGAQAFDGAALAADLETLLAARGLEDGPATVLHFWDRDCACSRFNQDHLRQLSQRYRAAGVRFLVMARRGGATPAQPSLSAAFGDAVAPFGAAAADAPAIPASPAAAVFDADGRLAYLGPYSEGAACLAGNGDFVEQVLDKLLAGQRPRQINTAAFGCFCDWINHS